MFSVYSNTLLKYTLQNIKIQQHIMDSPIFTQNGNYCVRNNSGLQSLSVHTLKFNTMEEYLPNVFSYQ